MPDDDDLQRFVDAQQGVYDGARAELAAGVKRSHWMWFVFPQLRGLGHSAMAHRYGLASLQEARDYLAHPLLGPRLRDCAALVVAADAPSLHAIFGSPDDVKFVSSMTLFAQASGEPDSIFERALQRWNGGGKDERTLALL